MNVSNDIGRGVSFHLRTLCGLCVTLHVLLQSTTTLFASPAAPAMLSDYDGHPFVTNPAPGLTFERRTKPSPDGIDYDFAEQTAHGVALLSRFPAFKLSDRRIHVDGPWYDTDAANVHFSRGIATIGAIPRYREKEDAPTNLRKIPQFQKWSLMIDPVWYAASARLAQKLEKENPTDPRIPALRLLSERHCYTNDQAAYLELGRYTFESERMPTDQRGEFVGYPAIDIETTEGWTNQRSCNGWLYQGMAEAAHSRGLRIVPMLYGQWQFSVGCFWESMRQGGKGDPEYLLPEKDFLAQPDPTLVACQENNGILSMDGYQQAMWGREPFFKRNADGSLAMQEGLPVFNDATETKAYGWTLRLEKGEAKQCLDNLYRTALRMYLQHYRRAGQYPADSELRKPFLSNCKIGAWSRYTNEGLQGIEQNDRPLPSWLLDLLIGMYLFTADDITLWSSDMNFYPGPLGGNYTNIWRYNAHGVLESVVKAAHRYSALDPLHAGGGKFQWCWFNLPVINKNETPGDRYFEKPIAFGKLRQFEGRTWLELFVAWPALDQTSKSLKVWIDQDGKQSKAWTIRLRHGRTYFYDAWQLPDEFRNLDGKHVWLRGIDLLGAQRTWRGDWRAPVDNTAPTPPDAP
jgi:hypothetical protein